jgi:hypothetical protein
VLPGVVGGRQQVTAPSIMAAGRKRFADDAGKLAGNEDSHGYRFPQ